jgi:site-specific recombinase XerD
MLYILLDTGIRASELCRIKLNHVDLKNRNIYIIGKGDKERYVPFSPRTGQVLWQFITTERSGASANHPLFVTATGNAFKRRMLHERLTDICKRAGVKKPTIHRFRHTFAINYLRNGGNVYALQRILGHSTLKMVKNYLAIAQSDIDLDHQEASPIANWGL